MVEGAKVPLEQARQQAQGALVFVWVAIGILIATTIVEIFVPFAAGLKSGTVVTFADGLNLLGVRLISESPNIFFAFALLDLRKVLNAYQSGAFFTPASATALIGCGVNAIAAVVMKIFGAPTLLLWVSQRGGGIETDFDLYDFGVLAIAMTLTLLGRVLQAAAAIKAENDEIV